MKRSTKIRICIKGLQMLFNPVALPLSRQTLAYTAGIIRRHLRQIGRPWRKLGCGQQALLVLASLRKSDTFAELTAGFGVGTATVWRYLAETVALLAAQSPELRQALRDARKVGQVQPGQPDSLPDFGPGPTRCGVSSPQTTRAKMISATLARVGHRRGRAVAVNLIAATQRPSQPASDGQRRGPHANGRLHLPARARTPPAPACSPITSSATGTCPPSRISSTTTCTAPWSYTTGGAAPGSTSGYASSPTPGAQSRP